MTRAAWTWWSRHHRGGIAALVSLLTLAGCRFQMGEGDTDWNSAVEDHRHDLEMDGYTLHYVDLGQGDPVILIHGFADSTYCWHEMAQPLAEAGMRVVLVDQPGMGRSGVPPAAHVYSVENHAAAALALADHLGFERFSLVGSSMGGAVSLYLGLHHPDRVERIVGISPACYVPPGHHAHKVGAKAAKAAEALIGRGFVRRTLRDVFADDSHVDEVMVDEYGRAMTKEGYAFAVASLSRQFFSEDFHEMTQAYSGLQPPLLLIWGELDTWVPLELGERFVAQLDGVRLEVFEGAGHLPHLEQPDEIHPRIVAFLGGEEES